MSEIAKESKLKQRAPWKAALVTSIGTVGWYGTFVLLQDAGYLKPSAATVTGVGGVVLLLAAHLWWSRNWLSVSLLVLSLPGAFLLAFPTIAASQTVGLNMALLLVASAYLAFTAMLCTWWGNKRGQARNSYIDVLPHS